jgi:isoleucyl-tRNA synthetase
MSQNDYSKTLMLPKTDFPMRANLKEKEPKLLKFWDEIRLYEKIEELTKERPSYILHDGPPYANGNIHAGTAMNKVLKDIVVKYKTMTGFYSPFLPGWDCHGLPIEHKVLTQLGEKAKEKTKLEIRKQCRKYAQKYVDIQREQFKRLGILGRWKEAYLTMDPEYETTVIDVFKSLYNQGYIYREYRPVYWCYSCETALADAEVEYKNLKSPSIFVRFEVIEGLENLKTEHKLPVYFIIWTTTPWTLPANVAIALNPTFQYDALKNEDGIYILARNLEEDPLEIIDFKDIEHIKSFTGNELAGTITKHPFYERKIPVVLADYVTTEQGTGCVHTAPGHGHDDFVTGRKYNLPTLAPVNENGFFTEEAKPYNGLFVFDADETIVRDLNKSGALLFSEDITHTYPHCWRCKEPVIFRATKQWFISVDYHKLRDKSLKSVKETEWIPSWGQDRITGMIENRPDWCISRQKNWGVPIPVFFCKECDEVYINDETLDKISELVRDYGTDIWFEKEPEELLPPDASCDKCGSSDFRKGEDILDVWFESGSSHFAVLKPENGLSWPSDMYLEGSDQHRGWFQLSLLLSLAVKNSPPFSTVLTHGFLLDKDGRAMHKSAGNAISPDEIIKQYGADVLRLWVTSENFRNDIILSFDILKQVSEVYRRIRNTFRFILGNLYDFTPEDDSFDYDELEEIDKFALILLEELKRKVLSAYESIEYHKIFHSVHNFCAVQMSSFYLDVIKDNLYIENYNSKIRRSTQTALSQILTELLSMLTPITPFTAEEVYSHIPGTFNTLESVHFMEFPSPRDIINEELKERWTTLLKIRKEVNMDLEILRNENIIGHPLDAKVEIWGDNEIGELLRDYKDLLKKIFIVSQVELKDSPGEDFRYGEEFNKNLAIKVSKASGKKCQRCWNFSESVGIIEGKEDLCERCVSILEN